MGVTSHSMGGIVFEVFTALVSPEHIADVPAMRMELPSAVRKEGVGGEGYSTLFESSAEDVLELINGRHSFGSLRQH